VDVLNTKKARQKPYIWALGSSLSIQVEGGKKQILILACMDCINSNSFADQSNK